jgi:5'-nucleotidase
MSNKLNVLISNDDGVHAPGIQTLFNTIKDICNATIIAPLEERSTTGHTISLDRPLRLQKVEHQVYGCTGYPGDCTLMGLGHVFKECKPDLVISGINRGANLGQDLYYSGTVAAAREAAFHGVPSIAVSLACEYSSKKVDYQPAANFIKHLVEQKIHECIPELSLLNINVPNLPGQEIKGVKYTTIGFRDYSEQIDSRVDSRNRDYYWVAGIYRGYREIGNTDCEAVAAGHVSFTPQILINSIERDFSQLEDLFEDVQSFTFD